MFELLPYSPAIDAAYVDENIPITDYYDSTRVDYPDVDNAGVGTESFYDMGPIEFYGPTGQMVLKPIISPIPGEYDEVLSVELSTPTEGAEIYYTLDGSYPTSLSSLYEGQFEIRSNTTVQARAFKEGLYDSPVLWADFTFSKDLVSPYIKGIIAADETTLRLIFNEPVEETTSTDLTNYSIAGITISNATLETDLSTVILTLTALESDKEYTLLVSGINDRADIPLWIYAAAGILTFIIAMATVSFHAVRASRRNPGMSLRYE